MIVKHLIATILILLWCGVATAQNGANPPKGCRKNLKINEFLLPDDAAAAKRAFFALRSALLAQNREQVVALINFPADFVLNGYGAKFENAKQFMEKYDEFFTANVVESVSKQDPEELFAGWDGVSLSDGAISFAKGGDGEFRVSNIRPKQDELPDSIAEFLDHRFTCPPVVAEGRIVAYDWVTHTIHGFEGIYIDHFIVDVTHVLRGKVPQQRIRVDFWGVRNLQDYNLPKVAFEPGYIWRMYLRPEALPPSNGEVCGSGVQESISNVDEKGREFSKESAIKSVAGEGSLTYKGLPCFEIRRQFLSVGTSRGSTP